MEVRITLEPAAQADPRPAEVGAGPGRPRAPKGEGSEAPAGQVEDRAEEASGPVPADEAPGGTEAQASAEPVEAPVASAIFAGNVDGAEVRLDGGVLGTLPDVTAEGLEPGRTYAFAVAHEGYVTREGTFVAGKASVRR